MIPVYLLGALLGRFWISVITVMIVVTFIMFPFKWLVGMIGSLFKSIRQ